MRIHGWVIAVALTVIPATLDAEQLAGEVRMKGLRWAADKQAAELVECPTETASVQLVDVEAHVRNPTQQLLVGLMAEVRIRWQEGPLNGANRASWGPWSLVDTQALRAVAPAKDLQLQTRLDVEGKRKSLEKRRKWPFALQVQITVRHMDTARTLMSRTATLAMPVKQPAPDEEADY
jgi:hypothetical protein